MFGPQIHRTGQPLSEYGFWVSRSLKATDSGYRKLDLIYQFVLDGMVGKFRVRPHSHFFQDSRAVSADGAVAQREQPGNFADRLSGSDQPHHLEFAI